MECCICFETTDNFIKFNPCHHQTMCVKCYLKTGWDQCPICQQKISHSNGCSCDVSIICQNMCNLELVEKYFKFIKSYLNAQDKGKIDIITIIHTITDAYQNLADKKICLISVDQCETLLQIAMDKCIFEYKDSHRLQHLLVRSCREGWKVDVKLGGSGVCYYGNMGDPLGSIEKTMSYVKSNHQGMMSSYIL